jgi:hypothetical protein
LLPTDDLRTADSSLPPPPYGGAGDAGGGDAVVVAGLSWGRARLVDFITSRLLRRACFLASDQDDVMIVGDLDDEGVGGVSIIA